MRLPQIGDEFEHRYQITHVLGEGGFATVYRAQDKATSRDVVLKVLSPRGGSYPEDVAARFHREARVFATLQSPHTITMYDFGQSSRGLLYLVFEFVHGQELGAVLFERGPFSASEVIHILTQLLSALSEAHQAQILHRDIKPANILLFAWDGDPFRVKLIDFGIAKDMKAKATKITRTGRIVGTLRYMAPEQIFGEPVDGRTDIFSLGLVGAEMLTGVPVVAGESKREMLEVQTGLSPLKLHPGVGTPALRAVIERMLEREPEDRFSSARDVSLALRDARQHPGGEPVTEARRAPAGDSQVLSEPSGSTVEEPPGKPLDWRVVGGLGAIVGLAAVGFAVTLMSDRPDEDSPRDVLQVLSSTPAAESTRRDSGGEKFDLEMDISVPDIGPDLAQVDAGTWAPAYRQLADEGLPVTAYFPSDEPPGAMPVVLMFHRRFRSGLSLLQSSQFAAEAEKHGFAVVAPDAPDAMSWPRDRLDIAFRALGLATQHANIDLQRVFVVGDEHATRYSNDIACAYPISGAATAFDGDSKVCEPRVATPRMRLWGLRDPQTPPLGGFGCNFISGDHPSAETIIGKWRDTYRCGEKTKPWGEFIGGTCRAFDCKTAPLVECPMETGHRWPGSDGMLVESDLCPTVTPAEPFPMAEAIWKFFDEEGRRLTTDEVSQLEAAIAQAL